MGGCAVEIARSFLVLLPFGRALTSRLIEPLVLRLAASERWRAMRRGWVWVLCGFFVILRSDSVAGRRVMCKGEEEVFSFGLILLLRLSTR